MDSHQAVRNARGFFIAISIIFLAGCGQPHSDLVPVVGAVTLDGAEFRGATVSFVPEGDKGETVKVGVSVKGMYSLASRDRPGVLPGRYKVIVEARDGTQYTTAVEVVKAANKRYDLKLTTK